TVALSGGQRLQHGSVRVLKELRGIEILNLRQLGFLHGPGSAEDVAECRNICYSDVLCQYWQYGDSGCRVEDPTFQFVEYPLTLPGTVPAGAIQSSKYAQSLVAGEFIQHYCPPRVEQLEEVAIRRPGPDPLGQNHNWRIVPYIIFGALVLFAVSCLAFCVLEYQKEGPAKSGDGEGHAAVRGAAFPELSWSSQCLLQSPATSAAVAASAAMFYYRSMMNMVHAFRIAHSGRPGPVHIDLPKDIVSMRAKVPDSVFKRASQTMADAPPMLNMADIKKAVDLINNAKRPIFYVGQGASHCPEILAKVAKKANIPVTTTLHAMGIFDERESLSLHMLGMHGAAYANFAIQNSDCIVAIGSRFDDRTTGIVAKYAPKAKAAEAEGTGGIVHINIDKSAFGKVVKPTVAVWADTKDAMEALDDLIVTPTDPARADWVAQCQEWKTSYPFDYVKAPDGQIKTQQVIKAINTWLHDTGTIDKKEVVVSTGVGNHQMMSCQFIRWTKPRQMITSGSLGVMGAGLPFCIGAQVAKPDCLSILIDGDGSFGMTNMDLQTVKRYQLPVKMAIMNDGRQQMVWIWQRLFFDGRYISVDNVNPDFVKLAQAYGIEAMSCDNEADLPGAIEKWLTFPGPMLMDFRVVPDICLPMVAPGKALDEMMLLQDRDAILGTSDEEMGTYKFEGLAPS
ncbi:unnamed protein product, partial [Polarella glacialis]